LDTAKTGFGFGFLNGFLGSGQFSRMWTLDVGFANDIGKTRS
jgi:hypothetical protein